MNLSRRGKLTWGLLIAILITICTPGVANAATITVCASGCNQTTIQAAIAAASPGDTISIGAGTYTETGQIAIDKNLTITGAGEATTIIKPAQDTGDTSSGDGRGWWLVGPGITVNMSGVTLDGTGKNICFGLYDYALGTIQNMTVKNIGCAQYFGRGIYLKNNATVRNVKLQNIERIGIFVWQGATAAVIDNITYVGKGSGDHLDYGIELGNGGVATITDPTISDAIGVAASDSSDSAAILVTTYFGPGTSATISGLKVTNSTMGIAVGQDTSDTATVVAHNNDLSGAVHGIVSTAPAVNATSNYWGQTSGPTSGQVVNGVGAVTTSPWCTDSACSTLSTNANLSALSLSSGTLSPAFSSTTTAYTASVGEGISSVTVSKTAVPGATSGACAGGSSLSVGSNTITCSVTSADSTVSKTYTITVTRAAPAPTTTTTVFVPPPTTTPPTTAPPVTTPPTTAPPPPPTTTPPVSTPPVTAPPSNPTAPVSAPTKPGQSGSIQVTTPTTAPPPPTPGTNGTTPPVTTPPKPVEVGWLPNTFGDKTVTIKVDPKPVVINTPTATPPSGGGTTPTTAPPSGGNPGGSTPPTTAPPTTNVGGGLTIGAGNAVLEIVATDEKTGLPVTELSAPMTMTFPAGSIGEVPAYSRDHGKTWTTIPRLTSPQLPPGQSDGFFVNPDGSVSILTLHLTLFVLLNDGQAPTVGHFSGKTTRSSTLQFAWSKVKDNIGIDHYVLKFNQHAVGTFSPVTTSASLPYRDGSYSLTAFDKAGNGSTFTAANGPIVAEANTLFRDVTPPTAPRFAVKIKGNSLRLSWSKSHDQSRITYQVFRDGKLVSERSSRPITLALRPGRYRVNAVDRAGFSTTSNEIRVLRSGGHFRVRR